MPSSAHFSLTMRSISIFIIVFYKKGVRRLMSPYPFCLSFNLVVCISNLFCFASFLYVLIIDINFVTICRGIPPNHTVHG